MTSPTYVDVRQEDGGRYHAVVVSTSPEAIESVASAEDIGEVWRLAKELAAARDLPIGATAPQSGDTGFVVRVEVYCHDAPPRSWLMWAVGLSEAESEIREAVAGKATDARIDLSSVDGQGALRVELASAEVRGRRFKAAAKELAPLMADASLPEAFRKLLAAHPDWTVHELYDVVRHGLGLDWDRACKIRHWQSDPAGEPWDICDAELDASIGPEVRRLLVATFGTQR